MTKIILFRHYFFYPSETFIYKQVQYLKNHYSIFLVSPKFSKEKQYSFNDVTKVHLGKLEKAIDKVFYIFKNSKVEDFFAFYKRQTLLFRMTSLRKLFPQLK